MIRLYVEKTAAPAVDTHAKSKNKFYLNSLESIANQFFESLRINMISKKNFDKIECRHIFLR